MEAGTAGFFGKVGLPPALAYVVMSAQLLGGIALILGAWTSLAAILWPPILFGAIFAVRQSRSGRRRLSHDHTLASDVYCARTPRELPSWAGGMIE